MSSLFADTHNVVAILKKSDAAEGFAQIIDFLCGSYIYYALTVNPHIYISCIKQFWNTASVKRSGDVTRLQVLVNKKKIVIFEAVIHEILQLNDAEGVNQVGDLSTHTTRFISSTLTQKVFANMRRVGKGLSRVETPLFEGMLAVGQPAEEGLVVEQVQVDDAAAAAVEENLQQVLNVCSALSNRVENLETDNAAQKLVIVKLKASVKKLEKANKIKSLKLRRLRKVGEDDSEVQKVVEVVTTAKLIIEIVTAAALQVSATSITIPAASATIPTAKRTIPAVVPTVSAAYTRRRKGVIIRDPEEE
nr:hypothetical protein [Tanacetum cinerariifolium]